MKHMHLMGVAIALTLSSHVASAEGGLTRAQVKEETKQADRDGELIHNDEGLKDNEINPKRYPKKPVAPGKTRAQVRQETQRARENGEIPVGEVGLTPREENPKRYPAQPATPGLTRSEVKAETLRAIRAGDVQVGEEGRTEAEKDPARYAGAPAKAPKLHLRRHAPKDTSGSSPAD